LLLGPARPRARAAHAPVSDLQALMRREAVAVACALTACLAARPGSADVEEYAQLVDAYLRGDRSAAVERVGQRSTAELRGQVKWLQGMRRCGHCPEKDVADRFPFLGAALLHTERALIDSWNDDSVLATFHLTLARALLEA